MIFCPGGFNSQTLAGFPCVDTSYIVSKPGVLTPDAFALEQTAGEEMDWVLFGTVASIAVLIYLILKEM